MSRPLRIEFEGAWHHVTNRGPNRREIFPGEDAYRVFLETVGEACRRFRLEVHAYCLMPGEYHLLVRTPLGNLARTMRHIDGLYTQRYNRLLDAEGPLFRGRYRAILIDATAYLLAVSRYIHRRPVDGESSLVGDPVEWPWSSYLAYIGRAESPSWLKTDAVSAALGQPDRFAAYRAYVEAGVEEEVARFYGKRRATPVLGGVGFRAWALGQAGESPEVPYSQRREWLFPEAVVAAVAGEWEVSGEAVKRPARLASPDAREARKVAMLICRDETGLTLAALGELFGGVHYSAVSQNIRRLQEAMTQDWALQARVRMVRSRLNPAG